jgi:hypothetical protein
MTATDPKDEELATKLEAIPYRHEIAGKDYRGFLLGLNLWERDRIVQTLRRPNSREGRS